MTQAAIDFTALGKMLYSSLLAGIGVSVIFSVVILGTVRSADLRRANRPGPAAAYTVLATVGLVVVVAVVVYGLILVAHK